MHHGFIFSSYYPSRRSVRENLEIGREHAPNTEGSVLMTEVKILPYRPTKLGYKMLLYGQTRKLFSFKNSLRFAVLADILLVNGDHGKIRTREGRYHRQVCFQFL